MSGEGPLQTAARVGVGMEVCMAVEALVAVVAVGVKCVAAVLGSVLVVRVVAVDHVRGHEAVDDAGHNLDAHKADSKGGHHQEASPLPGDAIGNEVASGRRQHAEESGEDLGGCVE